MYRKGIIRIQPLCYELESEATFNAVITHLINYGDAMKCHG